MDNLAIITARGGSKRIPKKNIKDFMGKPMLSYAIEAAKDSGIFDEIMVSTDDKDIAEVAVKFGAKVPFMRSGKTSDDLSTTQDVLEEVLACYTDRGVKINNFTCIYPCVPFLSGEILKDAYDTFIAKDADRLTPAVRFSFPIQRAMRINSDGYLEYREPKYAPCRSQDLEAMFHDAGMFYMYKYEKRFSDKIIMYEMPEDRTQDIDTLQDWKMAEIKFKIYADEKLQYRP